MVSAIKVYSGVGADIVMEALRSQPVRRVSKGHIKMGREPSHFTAELICWTGGADLLKR
jgi:hypothetical protein